MSKLLKRVIKDAAFKKHVWIGPATDESEVAGLIRKIRPRRFDGVLRRFGPPRDGGYLMPDDLEGVCACVSPGVSTECGFEIDLAGRGIDSYMADASVDRAPHEHPQFHFAKLFLDSYRSETTTTIDDYCRTIPGFAEGGDLILQMDIEGAEFRVIPSMSEALLKRFRIMVVEFHYLEQLFDRFCFDHIRASFEKMTRHHEVVHIHPNNYFETPVRHGSLSVPRILEFTFYRRDRAIFTDGSSLDFPHPLDIDNLPPHRPLVLPRCWR